MVDRSARRAVPARDAGLAVGLLGVGVVHVTYSVAQLRDLADQFDAQNAQLQIGAYTQPALATAAGWISSGVLVVALALGIGFAVPRIRSGRTAWWIPVVCAAIGWTVVIAICAATWAADPAVTARIAQGGT